MRLSFVLLWFIEIVRKYIMYYIYLISSHFILSAQTFLYYNLYNYFAPTKGLIINLAWGLLGDVIEVWNAGLCLIKTQLLNLSNFVLPNASLVICWPMSYLALTYFEHLKWMNGIIFIQSCVIIYKNILDCRMYISLYKNMYKVISQDSKWYQ